MGDGDQCQNCCRNLLRIILTIVNIAVICLGFSVFVVGCWGAGTKHDYVDVSDNTKAYAKVPILMIVIGLFVCIFGTLGVIGSIFAHKVIGRIILAAYGCLLALFVIIEFAGGIAAGVERNQVGDSLNKAFNDSFTKYNSNDTSNKDAWDALQKGFKCCGTYGYKAYEDLLKIEPPLSCCKIESNCNTTISSQLHSDGCTDVIKQDIKYILGVVAGIGITFALLQLIGVVFSCYVAIVAHKKASYEVV